MPEPIAIDKSNKLTPAEDYHFLRREGIRLIQQLAGKVWTDYNTHDPGITILEALCYTLTDLGYRTAFDIKDILAHKPGEGNNWRSVFYTARQVLPSNPVTLTDYRKIIIDTPGVRNAWIEPSDDYEIPIYLQAEEEVQASARQKYRLTYDVEKGDDILRLRGLYKVSVAYENDIIDNQKEEEVARRIKDKLQARRNLCEDFISVSAIEYQLFRIEAEVQVNEGTDIEKINARIYDVINDFFSPPVTFYSLAQMLAKGLSPEEIFEGPLLNFGFIDTEELEKSERFKNIHLSDIISLISGIEGVMAIKKFTFPQQSQSAFADFTEWITNIQDRQKVPRLDMENSVVTFSRSGDRHRDAADRQPNKARVKSIFSFLQSAKFNSRLNEPHADLPVPEGEFMNLTDFYPFQKTLPSIYGMSETFIDYQLDEGSIRNALNELLDDKVGVAIRTLLQELLVVAPDNRTVQKVINDLLNSGKEAVFEIINLLWEAKSDEELLTPVVQTLLSNSQEDIPAKDKVYRLLEVHQPNRFTLSRQTTILADIIPAVLERTLFDLWREPDGKVKKEQIKKLRQAYKEIQLQQLDTNKKLTLQLRGFFMVFEQLLADYLTQLANTRQLLSFDQTVQHTYFTQPLKDIPDQEILFDDYQKYRNIPPELTETEEDFGKRRNNVLDHLLARFGEDMSKYDFYLQASMGQKGSRQLIQDKINFLSDLIEVSNYRGRSFNYTNADEVWDNDNVEGLKKRICRLLGLKEYRLKEKKSNDEVFNSARDYHRKFIASDAIYIDKVKLDDHLERFVVLLTDPEDKKNVLLRSEAYEFESEAEVILNYMLVNGADENSYEKEERRDRWGYHLKRITPENDHEIVASRQFQSREEFEAAYKKTIATLAEYAQTENFHVVEHILLRPRLPARSRTNKNQTVLDADAVDFLSVSYVSDKADPEQDKPEKVLYKFKIIHVKDPEQTNKMIWHLSLINADHQEILSINEDFLLYKHLTRRIQQIRQFASDRSNYDVEQNADGYFIFSLVEGERALAVSKKSYRLREDLETEILNLIDFFSFEGEKYEAQEEDYHDISYVADPYSLQLSILIPNWPAKFRNLTFKHLLEKTIYLETPAHIYPHVYWLDHKQMRDFEEAYKLWLEELANTEIPSTDIVNNLVAQLNALRK